MATQIVFTNQTSVSHLTSALKATFHSCNFEGTQNYNRTLTKAQQHVYLHGVNCMHRSAHTRDPNSNPPKRSKFWSRSFGPPQNMATLKLKPWQAPYFRSKHGHLKA